MLDKKHKYKENAMKNKIIKCKSCGADIASSAKHCPSCGAKNKKPIYKRVWFWILVVVLLIAIADFVASKVNPSDSIEIETTTEEDSNAYVDRSEATVEIDCDKLAEAYNKNPDYYDKILNNQVAEWSGTITSIANSDNGEVLVYMRCGLNGYLIDNVVTATITNDKDKKAILSYKEGDKIKMKGIMEVLHWDDIDFFSLDYATIIG